MVYSGGRTVTTTTTTTTTTTSTYKKYATAFVVILGYALTPIKVTKGDSFQNA